MPLLRDGRVADDPWRAAAEGADTGADAPLIVDLAAWRAGREALLARPGPLGLRLKSHEAPEEIAADVGKFALIALEFPSFTDGRPYSAARLLRERYGYAGELRAVGNVLRDQLAFMVRCGFDAFEVVREDAADAYAGALADISVVYQPAADRRQAAPWRRHQPAG